MNDNFEFIKKAIIDFEENKISSETALAQINELSNTSVDIEWLSSYWNAMDLDSFVNLISTPPIENWKDLNDKQSIDLLKEIATDVCNDAVLQRNMTALEKRYSKPEGTISNWVFQEDIIEPHELLKRLKLNTTINL